MSDIDLLPSDLPYRLPAEAYAYLMRALSGTLPPLPDNSEETKTLRKRSIVAQISTLRPNDAIEASLAADHIIATEHGRDAARWIQIYRANGEHKLANQCRAQTTSMMREAKRALREIHRLQAETRARHADPQATDQAERIEHVTMIMTAEALERIPEPTPEAYVPQRPAPSRTPTARPTVSKTDQKSHNTKTETSPRQPERPRESPARRAMLDQAQFGPRGPGWDRPMFFPDKKPAQRNAAQSNPAEATPLPTPAAK